MGEYSESFTIDARWKDVKDLCIRYLTGFRFKLIHDEERALIFEKGTKRSNFFTFSFEDAYKHVAISIVGNEKAPVTTVSVYFNLPFLRLRKDDIESIKSMVKALREYILISVGYKEA